MATPTEDPAAFFNKSAPKVIEKTPPEKKEEPKGKGDQIADLRKAKDEAEAKVKELNERIEKEYKPLEELKSVKPIADHIKSKFEKLDEESINKYIENNRERKKKLGEIDSKLQEKELKLREIEITQSEDWIENYQRPIIDAKDSLFATVANLDGKGNVKHQKMINHLSESLLKVDEKTGKPYNHTQIKSILTKFAAEYEKETGEEYEIPHIEDVKKSVDTFISRYISAHNAKTNWEQEKEQKFKANIVKQSEEQKRKTTEELKAREVLVNNFINDYDYKKYEEVIGKDDLIIEFKNQHKIISDASVDPSKQTRNYNDFVELAAKGTLFDKVSEELKNVKLELQKEKEKTRSGLPGGGTRMEESKIESIPKGKDPADFLK